MRFICRVGTPEGSVVEQVHEGRDAAAVRGDLEKKGLFVFDVRRRGLLGALSLDIGGGSRGRVPIQQLLVFNQELIALLRSGLPLLQSIELLKDRPADEGFRQVLGEVRDRVKSGEAMSDAFAGFGQRFPALYAPTLQAGERSGELESVLKRFVRYQKLVLSTRKKVISALMYPAALIGLSLVLILVMTAYVLPNFSDFFAGLGAELPLLTRGVMVVADFLRANAVWLAGGALAAVIVLRQSGRTAAGRRRLDGWKLSVPFLGVVFERMSLSEFCRSLSTLLAGGIPIVPSLETSVGAIGNAAVRERLAPLPAAVREGKAMAEALRSTGVGEDLMIDMVQVGEETGALDQMLSDVSDFLDDEVDTRMQRILGLIEPAMLIIMAILVAILLVAVYLPMYSLLGSIGV
ncbi:MAG: type II secretion system F family protein [Acidobacteriota bacterium]|nr:type II secretion system F family protein [Acidobacteriota bacterium]MDH3521978.1 type II secretion system F family protein [Acidobacteriota bacterium]